MTINWFGEWFEIALAAGIASIVVIVLAITFLAVLIALKSLSGLIFVCDKCGCRFRLKSSRYLFSTHMNDDRLLKCPHCNKKGWCSKSHDQHSKPDIDEVKLK